MQKKNNSLRTKRNLRGQFLSTTPHPDPLLAAEGLSISAVERFLDKVHQTEHCWPWQGAKGQYGFGRFGTGGGRHCTYISARRAAWLIYNGEIRDGEILVSICPKQNTACVNPNHLTCGNRFDVKMLRGSGKLYAPLTNQQIDRFQKLCAAANTTQEEIISRITVTHQTPDWMIALGFSETFAHRFWAKVRKTDSCWFFDGSLNKSGYGTIGKGKDQKRNTFAAHVASFMLNKGPIPKGLWVCHNCPGGDNSDCVNPAHLWLGNRSQNMEDAATKRTASGEPHWHSTLTLEQLAELRDRYAKGETKASLARAFGISPIRVHYIVTRRRATDTFIWKLAGSLPHGTQTGNTLHQARQLIYY